MVEKSVQVMELVNAVVEYWNQNPHLSMGQVLSVMADTFNKA